MGKNTVAEVLSHKASEIQNIFCSKRDLSNLRDLLILAEEKSIKIDRLEDMQLEEMVGSKSHQGVVAKIRERRSLEFGDFLKKEKEKESGLILALDGIQDPQNFGAILRASECFGLDGVLISKNRGVGITPVVTKTSAGASELVQIISVSNLVEALRKLKSSGYWVIIASEKAPNSLNSFDFPSKSVIVFGSEGSGVRDLTRKTADYEIKIPMYGKIQSLNVAQAVAVVLSKCRNEVR